uniref:Metabotropic glutamate receptor 3 n=1 Tax=Eptatretus burgeri TaxID=7764 RepID=A0A8C4QUU7_EPTBU
SLNEGIFTSLLLIWYDVLLHGELMLGGLFPVHERGLGDVDCGAIQEARGIQRLEAMLFALDRINADKRLLPRVHLGARILDTCLKDTFALEQALELVRASFQQDNVAEHVCRDGEIAPYKPHSVPVAGILGGSDSGVSIQVANLLRLFKIPQISYASTSAKLSDKSRFGSFARTVPPDFLQAKAMADIVHHFGWTYIATIASVGDYGETGIEAFEQEARHRNICIAISEKIASSGIHEDFDKVVQNVQERIGVHAVALFLRSDDARGLLMAAQRLNATFLWVASDGWGALESVVHGNEGIADGAITVELSSYPVQEFDQYFLELTPNNSRNPWFAEFWEHKFGCSLSGTGSQACKPTLSLREVSYEQESKIMFVVNAVYAMAHALHAMHAHLCGNDSSGLCPAMMPLDGESLYKDFILNVDFYDPFGVGGRTRFDASGDGHGRYNVYNYQKVGSRFQYIQVGTWSESLHLDMQLIPWARDPLPVSQCSKPCAPNEMKSILPGERCCWLCIACRSHQYRRDEFTCADCEPGHWPTPDLLGCYDLPVRHINWSDSWAIGPLFLACVGMSFTVFTLSVFLRYHQTPVVKASGRELCYILLAGIFLCYAMTFCFVARPSPAVCALRRLGLGTSFAMCYAALLTKTNRIARIFGNVKHGTQKPRFISPTSQVTITAGLVSLQLGAVAAWLAVEPPHTRRETFEERLEVVLLKCSVSDSAMLLSLAYDGILIAMCTIYAFKTRTCPENFNEAKFIGFTMYTTCIIWLAFLPIFYVTSSDYRVQTTTMCVSMSLSGSVVLGCLFAPKVQVILFQPEQNVAGHRVVAPSRFAHTKPDPATSLSRRCAETTCNGREMSSTTTAL